MSNGAKRTKKIFIAFAIEDETQRDFLVGQARNEKSPFDFIDMSVKEPYDEKWKSQCRSKVKGCDGMIALISRSTAKSSGEKWEMTCATEERVPLIGIYAYKYDQPSDRPAKPAELGSNRLVDWTWPGIKSFIDSL